MSSPVILQSSLQCAYKSSIRLCNILWRHTHTHRHTYVVTYITYVPTPPPPTTISMITSTKENSGRFVAHSDNGNKSQAADSFGIVEGCLTKDHIEVVCFCSINLNHILFRWCIPIRRTCKSRQAIIPNKKGQLTMEAYCVHYTLLRTMDVMYVWYYTVVCWLYAYTIHVLNVLY